ncbi:MAG TPA: glycosyltransferase 87 family protein [Gaiellaceae bacterium]|nr:glycosyltransferase 87 family protein [Gaiellaceae bacterium]
MQLDRTSAALAAAAVFLVCWGLVHTWFWGHGQLVDWPVYQTYGDAIVHHGEVPYRDFAVEYPPGALPSFVVPSLFGDYAAAFAWTMCACGVALVAVVARVRPLPALYVALAPVLVGSLILSRFDLWPALLATAALVALLLERPVTAWALLGLAVAAKLWPVVLVPVAFVRSWRRGDRRAPLAGAATLLAAVVPFAVLAPHGVWASVRGQASRPLQIESLGAAFFTTFGHPRIVSSHGSQNVAGHATAATALALVQVAALVALWLAFARGPVDDSRLVRYAAAAVTAFVVFDKVLSPQYLLWLIPLVPLVRGARGIAATAALTAACVLTQVWFPLRYWSYANDLHLAGVVLARDLALVGLLGILALPVARRG